MSVEIHAELYYGIRYLESEIGESFERIKQIDPDIDIDDDFVYALQQSWDVREALKDISYPDGIAGTPVDCHPEYFHKCMGSGVDDFILGLLVVYEAGRCGDTGETYAITPSLLEQTKSWNEKLEAIAARLGLPYHEPSWFLQVYQS